VSVVIASESSGVDVYVNGVYDSNSGWTPSLLGDKLTLGTYWGPGSTQGHIQGTVDDFTLWNRALTAGEIASLTAGPAEADAMLNGLVVYYDFDDTPTMVPTTASSPEADDVAHLEGNASHGWMVGETLTDPAIIGAEVTEVSFWLYCNYASNNTSHCSDSTGTYDIVVANGQGQVQHVFLDDAPIKELPYHVPYASEYPIDLGDGLKVTGESGSYVLQAGDRIAVHINQSPSGYGIEILQKDKNPSPSTSYAHGERSIWSGSSWTDYWDRDITFELKYLAEGTILANKAGGIDQVVMTQEIVNPIFETVLADISETWHHIAFTQAGGVWTLYLDAVAQASGAGTGGLGLSLDGTYNIGSSPDGGYPLAGALDDFRIYNEALSVDAIVEIFQEGVAP